jgi:hypothetical protein
MAKLAQSPYPPSQLAVSQDPLILSRESPKPTVRILGVTAPVDPILRPRKKGPTGRQELALVLGRRLIFN